MPEWPQDTTATAVTLKPFGRSLMYRAAWVVAILVVLVVVFVGVERLTVMDRVAALAGRIGTPADSVATPAGSVATPADSVATPADSVATPADSVATPVDRVAIPVDSVAIPVDRVAIPVDSAQDIFTAELRVFDTETTPALAAVAVEQWAPEAYRGIIDQKEQALAAYTVANYPAALTLLRTTEAAAEDLLQRAAREFSLHLEAAISAFANGDPVAAEQHIRTARIIRREHATAQAYAERIAALPEVLQQLEAAAAAAARQDISAQRDALAEVVRLDPARSDSVAHLGELEGEIAGRAFDSAIAAGTAALVARDAATARSHLERAQKLFPGRESAVQLQAQVRRLDRELAYAQQMAVAQAAVAADDWDRAHTAFGRALALDGTAAAAVQGESLATRIRTARGELRDHIDQPDRLTTPAIAAAAAQSLAQAESLLESSAQLAADAERLSALLTEYTTPVTVMVHSDDHTDIQVEGIGTVGKIKYKEISLKPGHHIFEGRRLGYRSVRIPLTVPLNGSAEVTVICDERI